VITQNRSWRAAETLPCFSKAILPLRLYSSYIILVGVFSTSSSLSPWADLSTLSTFRGLETLQNENGCTMIFVENYIELIKTVVRRGNILVGDLSILVHVQHVNEQR